MVRSKRRKNVKFTLYLPKEESQEKVESEKDQEEVHPAQTLIKDEPKKE